MRCSCSSNSIYLTHSQIIYHHLASENKITNLWMESFTFKLNHPDSTRGNDLKSGCLFASISIPNQFRHLLHPAPPSWALLHLWVTLSCPSTTDQMNRNGSNSARTRKTLIPRTHISPSLPRKKSSPHKRGQSSQLVLLNGKKGGCTATFNNIRKRKKNENSLEEGRTSLPTDAVTWIPAWKVRVGIFWRWPVSWCACRADASFSSCVWCFTSSSFLGVWTPASRSICGGCKHSTCCFVALQRSRVARTITIDY